MWKVLPVFQVPFADDSDQTVDSRDSREIQDVTSLFQNKKKISCQYVHLKLSQYSTTGPTNRTVFEIVT